MKNTLIVIIVLVSLFSIKVSGQVLNDNAKLLIGPEFNTYKNDPLGFEIKLIRHKKISLTLKTNQFDYSIDYPVNISEGNYSNQLEKNSFGVIHHISGYTFKPGISVLNIIRRRYIITWSQSIVLTPTKHDLLLTYEDGMGYTEKHHNRSVFLIGFESEFTFHLRFLKHFYFATSGRLGYKQTNLKLYNEQIKDYPTFLNYTPSQGYSPIPYYINVSAGLGLVL